MTECWAFFKLFFGLLPDVSEDPRVSISTSVLIEPPSFITTSPLTPLTHTHRRTTFPTE